MLETILTRRMIGPLFMTTALAGITACKPPPTDAGLDRDMPASEPTFASEPLPSPETEGAVWASSSEDNRIIYGIPGKPALLALACIERDGAPDSLRITRIAPADENAEALMAIIGNGSIGRIEVDATKQGKGFVWQGELPAIDTRWEPLAGPRQVTATVPGGGMVTLNPSRLPLQLVDRCRGIKPAEPPENIEETEAEAALPDAELAEPPPEIPPPEYEEPDVETDLGPIS